MSTCCQKYVADVNSGRLGVLAASQVQGVDGAGNCVCEGKRLSVLCLCCGDLETQREEDDYRCLCDFL